jgi:hypothetical protein
MRLLHTTGPSTALLVLPACSDPVVDPPPDDRLVGRWVPRCYDGDVLILVGPDGTESGRLRRAG